MRPLLAGSMGEAHHLSHSERVTLIKAARQALDEAGLTTVPIIAGTGAGSTRETIELCKEAAEAGADYCIVIASGYFAGVLANNRKALKAFWTEVAAKSPIPVIIYNCASSFPCTCGLLCRRRLYLRIFLPCLVAKRCPSLFSPSNISFPPIAPGLHPR